MLDAETEADKMSLDDGSCSSSEAPEDDAILEDDLGDVTDEEDWASIGAAALRAGSFPSGGGGRIYSVSTRTLKYRRHGGGGPVKRALAASMPAQTGKAYLGLQHQGQQLGHAVQQQQQQQPHPQPQLTTNNPGSGRVEFSFEGMGNDSQEREAIEALVSLSNV